MSFQGQNGLRPVLLKALGAASSGLLLSLAFPMRFQGFSDEFHIPALAWFALIPLFLVLSLPSARRPLRAAFGYGWGTGTLFFAVTISWVTHSMMYYGGLSMGISLLILLLFSTYLGTYFGLFAALWTFVRRQSTLPNLLIAPPIWVGLEWLRGHLLTGFPWAGLGYSQYEQLHLIQIADTTGVYGVSFLIVAVNAALVDGILFVRRRTPGLKPLLSGAVTLIFIAAALVYGDYRLSHPPVATAPFKAAVVQGNIPQDLKWSRTFQNETLSTYERLTRQAADRGAVFVVWPETAVPLFYQDPSEQREGIRRLVQERGIYLLFGSPAYKQTESGRRPINSAYLLAPGGDESGRYDKIHLVPFGEYVPLASLLSFVNRMAEGIGDFIPGEELTLMKTPWGDVGTVICFEVIFPDLVRRFVDHGATVMTTLTNDAWFGKTGAPYQHFAMVVFRAVENRVPFARAANTGISGFIDTRGHILQAGPIFEEAVLTQTLSPRQETSFYTRFGDLFAALCALWTLAILAFGIAAARPKMFSLTKT